MNKKPTYWRWFAAMIMMVFLWSGNYQASAQCIATSPYGSGTLTGLNSVTITYCNYAGEFSTLTVDASAIGAQYSFTGTGGTGNYFTLTNTSNVPIVWGASPLVYTFSAAGTYRLHIHTSAACGTDFSCHTVIAAPVIPAPANDLCANAITISCGDVVAATTVGATTTGAPTNCLGALNTAGGVWYKFTGNGLPATVSLCGSSFDTKIGVFSGTCGALVCEAYNDDFCGASSEVSFPSVMGTEYLVYVTGYSASTGNFTLSLSCVNPGLEILTPNLSLGYRPIGAWMEPARLSIVNNPGAGAMVITAADIDNNYGGFVDVVAPALPFTLPSGVTTTAFGLTANDEATAVAGAFNGTFAIIYGGSRALATVTYDGTAYVPQPYDVVENAGTLPPTAANMAPAELPQQSSRELGGYYKNYILPNDLGTSPTDLDYVYKLTPAVDMLFSISAAFGTPVNYAVYASDFGGQGGPMATNALVQSLNTLTNYPLLAGHTYYCVASGLADFTSNYSLVPMPGPDAATYVSPLDGAINISNGMSLNWTFGANTTEYQVILGTTYPPTTVVVPFTGNLATSYVLAGLQPNMQYFWQVNTRNTQGTTMGPVWGFTTTIDVPTGLTVTLVDPAPTAPTVSANINWTGPSDRAFIGYNVYRNGVKLNAAPLTVSQYTDLGLARNTTYSYQVSNVFDEGESTLSAPVTVTTKGVGIFNGFVYNFLGGAGIQGATVRVTGTAGDFTVATAANGSYSIQAYAGTYEFIVSAAGYTTQNRPGQAVAHGGSTPNDFYMMEVPYPVGDVVAFELNPTTVQISWDGSGPEPITEWLYYDDGIATQYWWAGAGAPFSWAINFLPADLAGLDGTSLTKIAIFNTAASDVNTLSIYEGDLSAGTATLLHTQALTGLTLEDWNEVELTSSISLDVTKQLWIMMHSPSPTGGVAASSPIPSTKGDWVNFTGVWQHMGSGLAFNVTWNLRAFVTNAVGSRNIELVRNIAGNDQKYFTDAYVEMSAFTSVDNSNKAFRSRIADPNSRAIVSYDVWREKVYQPGTLELIGTTFQQNFVDFDWGIQDWGVYRWAVTVNYDAGQVSAPTFSNTLEKDMYTVVDVTVALNSNESAAGTLVTFTNLSEPALELVYEETLGSSGQFTWEMFRKGVYDIAVFKAGYMPQSMSAVEIFDEASFEWLLIEILSPPTDLYVTPTGFATWSGGIGTPFEPFMESFDGLTAGQIPEGWTKTPTTTNWGAHIGTQAGGVAPQMRFNWSPSGINDFYLMTPVMSTIGQSSLQLSFKHSINDYNGNYTLRVVAIADGTEHIIQEWLTPDDLPSTTEVYDLTAAHGVGAAEFQIAWVLSGNSFNINYWYLDDISLIAPSAKAAKSFESYKVFHDGVLVAEVGEAMYQYGTNGEALVDGTTYLAEVAAVYSTGQSAKAAYTWTYIACGNYATPGSFTAAQVEGTLNVALAWTVPAIPVGEDQIDFARIYRDGEVIAEVTTANYLDLNLDLGTYNYCITFVYESGAETCPATVCATAVVTGGGMVNGNVKQAAYLGGANIEGAVLTLTNTANSSIVFTFVTNAAGNYSGEVLAGTYNYLVEAEGYIAATLAAVPIPQSSTVTRNFELMEFPAPVELVVATELSDAAVQVTWRTPGTILFEPSTVDFNNGLPADWTVVNGGSSTHTWNVVPSYSGSTLNGTPFAFVDSDGAGSGSVTLDEMLVSPVMGVLGVTELYLQFQQYYRHLGTGSYGQVDVFDGTNWVTVLNQTATAGSFTAPNFQSINVSAYINPNFQVRFHYFDNTVWAWYWAVDNVTITDEAPTRGLMAPPVSTLAGYNVYRTSCEEGGSFQFLGYTLDTLFNDNTWATAESGTYKWAVEAVYEANVSEKRFSNCLDKDMVTQVSVTVITNSGDSPEGTDVTLTNTSEPELGLVYETELDATGYFLWEEFRKGTYEVYVEKNGFAPIMETVEIDGPTNLSYILEELLLPVSDLHVTPTGFATWTDGGIIIIPFEPYVESFDGLALGAIPEGWSKSPETTNWGAATTANAGGASPEMRFSWTPSSTNNFYLKSSILNTEGQSNLQLSFKHSINDYNGAYTLRIVAIADGTEYTIHEWLTPSNLPSTTEVFDLTSAHGVGATEFQIAWVLSGNSFNINYWYFDDVSLVAVEDATLANGGAPESPRALQYYKVWLDGIVIADTENTYYQYDPAILTPGQEYFSEVAAMYSNGMSAKMNYTWTYYPCDSFPGPDYVSAEVVDINDVVLDWSGSAPPPPPTPIEIVVEPFEEYTAGGKLAQQAQALGYTYWTTWSGTPGSAEDPTISTAQASQGTKSVVIEGTNDAVLLLDSYTSGKYKVKFDVYIPNGKVGYFNLLQKFQGASSQWGMQAYFDLGGAGHVDAGGEGLGTFSYAYNTWHTVVVDIDLDANHAEMRFNNNLVVTWVWSGGAFGQGTLNEFNAMNLYAWNVTGTPGAFFDNIIVTQEVPDQRAAVVANNALQNIDPSVKCVAETAILTGNEADVKGVAKSLGSSRAILFNNGPLVNSAGTGVGGADESILQGALGLNSYGFNVNNGAGYRMADDFVVDATWTVESLEFYAYQTGSTTTSTITGAYVQIYNGAPNAGGTVVYGDLTTNRMSSTTFSNIYRNNNGPGGATNRPIMSIVCNVTGLTLQPGTYWVEYSLTGSLASGPWSAPITINGQTTTGNALQWTGAAWAALQDGGTFTPQGIPFLISGTVSGGGGGGGTFDPGEYLGANIYRDGVLIAEQVQGETYTDMNVEPGYYDYCVTFVYADGAESCLSTCVLDVLVTEDCKVPQNLTATLVEENNEVTLVWNENIEQEFRYDDGVATAQLGSSGGTINTVLGAKHTTSAELTQMSWYLTGEGGPHTSIKIYVFGLTSAGLPNGNNVLYSATVSNTDNMWNTHTFPTPVVADGGFLIGVAYNGFVAIGTDDGVGAPYVFQPNTHYFVGDYTAGGWEPWETYGFNFNGTIRAVGVVGAKASYAVAPLSAPSVSSRITLDRIDLKAPVNIGDPVWSQPVRSADREFLGYNIYRDGALLEALWPETTYVYLEGEAGVTCYTVTAEYEFCGETEPSNEACVDIVTSTENNDLSKISVYPNPSNSDVNIELTSNVSQVVIYNYLGQVVYENKVTDLKIRLDVRNYEAGAYLVKFVTREGESFTKKVVVTH